MLLRRIWISGILMTAAFRGATIGGQSPSSIPTFTKDIAPIFYANCVSCHRPGEIAPMSLMTYPQVRPWARSIRGKIQDGTMSKYTKTNV